MRFEKVKSEKERKNISHIIILFLNNIIYYHIFIIIPYIKYIYCTVLYAHLYYTLLYSI